MFKLFLSDFLKNVGYLQSFRGTKGRCGKLKMATDSLILLQVEFLSPWICAGLSEYCSSDGLVLPRLDGKKKKTKKTPKQKKPLRVLLGPLGTVSLGALSYNVRRSLRPSVLDGCVGAQVNRPNWVQSCICIKVRDMWARPAHLTSPIT